MLTNDCTHWVHVSVWGGFISKVKQLPNASPTPEINSNTIETDKTEVLIERTKPGHETPCKSFVQILLNH